jgi:CubicO group peptidase (beta-lactamase class C family)
LAHNLFGQSMDKDLYDKARINDRAQTNAELVAKLAKLPLQWHPGSTWDYSISTDVLARIVEVVSGMTFDTFVAEHISKPLKLADTGFWVEVAKHARIAEPQIDKATGQRPRLPDVTSRPNWIRGGAGLVSTALDYARFCQLFLDGGQRDGVRLVSRKTVELMTADHIPPGTPISPTVARQFGALTPSPAMGQGFGLGFAVRTHAGRNPLHGSVGEYYWVNLWGTSFWIDPAEKMFVVLMMHPAPAQRWHYRYVIRELAYQAVAD